MVGTFMKSILQCQKETIANKNQNVFEDFVSFWKNIGKKCAAFWLSKNKK